MFRDNATEDAVKLRFHTVEKLGPKQSRTPEGYLVCEDVPLCRTGTLTYGPNEIDGVSPGKDGVIYIHRSAEDVFTPEHIASFSGKDVTNEHPPDEVNTGNWKEYSVGVVLNPHRGEGPQADLLIGDFVIKDPDAIQEVLDGKREVSCGYDADYEEAGPGEGRQFNLFANHVALVTAGRCGARCSIRDRKPEGVPDMFFKDGKRPAWMDKMLKAWQDKDEEAMKDAVEEASTSVKDNGNDNESATHVHVHSNEGVSDEAFQAHVEKNNKEHQEMRDSLAELKNSLEEMKAGKTGDSEAEEALEKDLEEEAPVGTKDKARKAHDSAYMVDSFQEAVAGAEILAPGIRIPTLDRAAAPGSTLKAVCALRRKSLDLAYHSAETRDIIDDLNAGQPLQLEGMSCSEVRTLFRGAVTAKKVANTHDSRRTKEEDTKGKPVPGVKTVADLNAQNAKHYGNQ